MEKAKILIIEDEQINRVILTNLLKNKYEVYEAQNGQVALELINNNNFAAVLLDLIMPVMDGFALLAKIKEQQLDNLPVIVVTTKADEISETKALKAGAWDYVNKPYNVNILFTRLENAIAKSQLAMYKAERILAYDSLTGLYNRNCMFQRTRIMIDTHPQDKFTFLRLDIDHFALYNSTFGEEEGNKLLCYVADFFKEISQQFELVTYGHVYADVFCVCVKCNGNIEKINGYVREFQDKVTHYNDDYLLEISVGVYIIKEPSLSIEECYLRANMGSQKCKRKYECHVGYYDEALGEEALAETVICNEMKTALKNDEFVVYIQPKIDLSTDAYCGGEALVRWQHPQKGLIPPNVFIPIFEKNGFIFQLDYWVWEKTCQMLRDWLDAKLNIHPISVNISRVSLYNPRLLDLLNGLVSKYQLPKTMLQLEITESAYMSNPELMKEIIVSLKEADFIILMDDFGSGYSSLNTLKDIEVDILKIDMKFLPLNSQLEKGEIILTSIIKMCKWLDLPTVVEGVETREQRDFLEATGCKEVQGYYYSKPLPRTVFEQKYLRNQEQNETIISKKELISIRRNGIILVIDDEELDRRLIKEYFKDYYYVHQSETAEDALMFLKDNYRQVRLILVDHVMPGFSGLDFLTYCLDEVTLVSIPKIMITSSDNNTNMVKAFELGAYDYITKPLVKEVVEARVNHVMNISSFYRDFESWNYDLRNLGNRDNATGLFNSDTFFNVGNDLISKYAADLHALLLINIADFRFFNEQDGVSSSDKVIKNIAQILTKEFRNCDLIGQSAGDEFMVLMNNIPNCQIAINKANYILQKVTMFAASNLGTSINVRVGISFSSENEELEQMLNHANEALLQAKEDGKQKIAVYGKTNHTKIANKQAVVLIYSLDLQLLPMFSLACGEVCTFVWITNENQLEQYFQQYKDCLQAICLDMESHQSEIIKKIRSEVKVIGIVRESNMLQVEKALALAVDDLITLPSNLDSIKRIINRAVTLKNS